MAKKLSDLIEGVFPLTVKGPQEIAIKGIAIHSQQVLPGDLFFAKKGSFLDGKDFISQAIEKGAVAVVSDAYHPDLSGVTQIVSPDPRALEAIVAHRYFEHPSEQLFMVGVTGTNGKTTTTFILKQLLDQCLGPCGLIGTIEYIVAGRRYPSSHTTPDLLSNLRLLEEMVKGKDRSAVMEVSSHGLDQRRVEGIEFDVAIFSNLSVDHLDYHGTMEAYAAAKKKLFDALARGKKRSAQAVVNADSLWTPFLVKECQAPLFSYGIEQPADLCASNIEFTFEGTRSSLSFQGKKLDFFWPFVGKFNVYNVLGSLATCLICGVSLEELAHWTPQLLAVKGRLQAIPNQLGLSIFVDFAHSDDALVNVMRTLKENFQGRLIVVFGCGGDRDKSKRKKMGAACEKMADYAIITSDNPRSEDPMHICEEIAQGFSTGKNYTIESDRSLAIEQAIKMATKEDRILIAGKGHESVQIFADHSIEFDDGKVAAAICEKILRDEGKVHV